MQVDASNPQGPWIAYLQGPVNTIWECGVFRIELQFNDKYPLLPMHVKFADAIFHPNVGPDGTICSRLLGDQWSPVFTVMTVLTYLRSMLHDPNFSAVDSGKMLDEASTLAEEDAARKHNGRSLPQKLYHYTDPVAIKTIESSKCLKESGTGAGGPGVYASSLHPTNRTKEQILGSNYGGRPAAAPISASGAPGGLLIGSGAPAPIRTDPRSNRADFVIELDVDALQSDCYKISKLNLGPGRDVWLITCSERPHDIQLTPVNSHIAKFENMCSCALNKLAHQLLKGDGDEYNRRVSATISQFGQHLLGTKRQSLAVCQQVLALGRPMTALHQITAQSVDIAQATTGAIVENSSAITCDGSYAKDTHGVKRGIDFETPKPAPKHRKIAKPSDEAEPFVDSFVQEVASPAASGPYCSAGFAFKSDVPKDSIEACMAARDLAVEDLPATRSAHAPNEKFTANRERHTGALEGTKEKPIGVGEDETEDAELLRAIELSKLDAEHRRVCQIDAIDSVINLSDSE
jgi:ubiquitin-protein ligase